MRHFSAFSILVPLSAVSAPFFFLSLSPSLPHTR
ncbi:hypothetical protein, unknown function [Leishmania donovani]|uniref:Uncharacterized protein n=1 Tax=Leishmania donovani TaxID=5661 RepID=E9BB82_LEIDO|nr:hypothetical protein, unknown function [Leishmania donovani]CBZ32507.1 hypothetical protein, unknown function [Leishmania donovani]